MIILRSKTFDEAVVEAQEIEELQRASRAQADHLEARVLQLHTRLCGLTGLLIDARLRPRVEHRDGFNAWYLLSAEAATREHLSYKLDARAGPVENPYLVCSRRWGRLSQKTRDAWVQYASGVTVDMPPHHLYGKCP